MAEGQTVRRLSRHARIALFIAACACTAARAEAQDPTAPQQPQPSESPTYTLRAFSHLTVVDITAFDSRERPVLGLPESAFTVLEDGKPQPIRSFSETTAKTQVEARPVPKLPPHIYTNLQPTPETSAVNVLLLDSLNTSLPDQVFVKDEATKFLKSMLPGTRIAILGLSSKLRLLQGITSDPAILLAAVNSKKNSSLPSPFIDTDTGDATDTMMDAASADASVNLQEFENEQASFQADMRNRMTMEALNQIAAYLSGIKGRKNLIWFTDGMPLQVFPSGGLNDLAALTDYSKDLRHTTDLLTAAQIAVYPVDATGVTTVPAASVVTPPRGFASGRGDSMGTAIAAFNTKNAQSHLGMEAVAEATGGVAYYNTNGLKEAVQKAIQNGENYYTVSYVPPSPAFNGVYHQITVKVNVPGVHLAYRKGYYADDLAHNEITSGITLASTAPEPYGNNMQASMGRGVPTSTQLLFTARVEPAGDAPTPPGAKVMGTLDAKLRGKPLRRYDFQYSLPGRQITFKDGPDGTHKGTLEFDVAAYDVYGKLITGMSQSIDLTLTEERYKQLQSKPFQMLQQVDLPFGEEFVRLGILDANSDRTGTLEVPVQVTRKPSSSGPVGPSVPQAKPQQP